MTCLLRWWVEGYDSNLPFADDMYSSPWPFWVLVTTSMASRFALLLSKREVSSKLLLQKQLPLEVPRSVFTPLHRTQVWASQNSLVSLASRVSGFFWPQEHKSYYPFLSKLSDTGRPVDELVAMVVGLAVGSSVNEAQGNLEAGGGFTYWLSII